MRTFKWIFYAFVGLFVVGFLHYSLPQHDIVRIVNTYEERQSLSGWTTMFWGDAQSPVTNGVETRDVQFIQSVKANGKPMVYRNEDTGFGWPPYFKVDTASLYTEAADAVSTKDAPEWVIVTHYGWRSELLSIFPNAVGVKPATGPDQRIIPWVSIVILVLILIVLLLIRRMWLQFRERTIDPLVENVGEKFEDASDATRERADGVKRWFRK